MPTAAAPAIALPSLPAQLENLLRQIGQAGEAHSLPTFVVGGFVRDWLLCTSGHWPLTTCGERSRTTDHSPDLDIVVEGDAHQLALHLHPVLGGRLTLHRSFGTASLKLEQGRIDFTSARGETYPHPAALPNVFFSSLEDDLFRRDFTINALAVQLNPSSFGQLVDFFGGKADLDRRLIRILHDKSFLDDPTRIFRAIRFEQRLGFHLEANTERLLKEAVRSGLISRLSPARIREQLRLLFSEPDPIPPALRAHQFGVFSSLHPRLALSPQAEAILRRTPSALNFPDSRLKTQDSRLSWLLFLLPFTLEMSPKEAQEFANSLRFRRSEAEVLLEVAEKAQPTLASLTPSQIWEILHPLNYITLVHLLARYVPDDSQHSLLLAYLTQYRHTRLQINGNDLQKAGFPPGPALGQALNQTLKAKLDGKVSGKNDELSFALRLLRSPLSDQPTTGLADQKTGRLED